MDAPNFPKLNMTPNEIALAVKFLADYSEVLGSRTCNDWDFPKNWTLKERQDFTKRYHEYNGDPEEYDPEDFYMVDFGVAGFLAHLLKSVRIGPCCIHGDDC